MHTPLCKHAFGEPELYAEKALAQGLAGIIFTCHSPMPGGFWPQVRMDDSQFDDYLALVERCRLAYEGRLEVRLGLESDYFPGLESWSEKLHQRADFHYILGSVHWQGPEYGAKFDPWDARGFRKSYFENLAASAECGFYDSLAHPDLIKNYRSEEWNFEEWEDTVADSLDRIARTGVAMELNTSGLNKHYSEMNPSLPMLKMMAARGIPVVIGSDSHVSKRVGDHFVEALMALHEAGYENVSVFKHRKRSEFAIDEMLGSLNIELPV
jgi:histidinol-phosphatase (PHP family)